MNRGSNRDGGTYRGNNEVTARKNREESSMKSKPIIGYNNSRLESQPPARKKSSGMSSESLESENEEKSESEDDRRERIRESVKLGGRNKTAREYANGIPSTNEDGRLIGKTKSGDKQQ